MKDYTKLSDKMQEVYDKIKEHQEIYRWGECYWTYKSCEYYRGENCDIPNWICQTSTLRALAKRDLITLDEEKNIARIKN